MMCFTIYDPNRSVRVACPGCLTYMLSLLYGGSSDIISHVHSPDTHWFHSDWMSGVMHWGKSGTQRVQPCNRFILHTSATPVAIFCRSFQQWSCFWPKIRFKTASLWLMGPFQKRAALAPLFLSVHITGDAVWMGNGGLGTGMNGGECIVLGYYSFIPIIRGISKVIFQNQWLEKWKRELMVALNYLMNQNSCSGCLWNCQSSASQHLLVAIIIIIARHLINDNLI